MNGPLVKRLRLSPNTVVSCVRASNIGATLSEGSLLRVSEIPVQYGTKKLNKNGPLVKRLRHHPLTVVSWVRVPYGSPNKLKTNPFPLGDGFAFIVYFNS